MKIHVTRAYLDLARVVIDAQIHGNPDAENSEDVIFALMSCTYIYSFMALTAFSSSHLHEIWIQNPSKLKIKYKNCDTFEQLMAGPLKELKVALNELSTQLGITPIHKSKPAKWRELNEMLKGFRDYFVHPNPEAFHNHVQATVSLKWAFPSKLASEIIGYYFQETGKEIPSWVSKSSISCRGFNYVGT